MSNENVRSIFAKTLSDKINATGLICCSKKSRKRKRGVMTNLWIEGSLHSQCL